MTSVPGVDYPEEQRDADVMLTGRGISVNGRVEMVSGNVIVLRPSAGDFVDNAVVGVGNDVEVYWRGPEDQRMVPARVQAVESGAVLRWRLEITGEAEISQRRKAVRARVKVPVEVGHASFELSGESVDLSEAGMRVAVDGMGFEPEPGSRVDLRIALEDGEVPVKAEVVRLQARGARWTLSLRFIDLQERDGDRFRRRVFQALREERARAND